METKKIVVVVEEVEEARTALQWALHNLLRYGDVIILLHVFPSIRSRNKKKRRVLRLKGFQLALSFKDLCDGIPDAKVEIVVREGGDQEVATTIASMVREIGASALVAGLHDHSFLYKMVMAHTSITNDLNNCRVLAIKQHHPMTADISTNFNFSQIEISRLSIPHIPPQKIPYQILPSPFGIIWKSRRRKGSSK